MTEQTLRTYLAEILEDYIVDEEELEDALFDLENFITANFDIED